MRTTIDKAGRLVLPKATRDRLGLKAGDVLEIEPTGEGLHLKPVRESPRLVKEGNVLVYAAGVLDKNVSESDVVKDVRDGRIAELVRQAMS